jgi:hypothetical protein
MRVCKSWPSFGEPEVSSADAVTVPVVADQPSNWIRSLIVP